MATAASQTVIVLTLTETEAEQLWHILDSADPDSEYETTHESVKEALYPMF